MASFLSPKRTPPTAIEKGEASRLFGDLLAKLGHPAPENTESQNPTAPALDPAVERMLAEKGIYPKSP